MVRRIVPAAAILMFVLVAAQPWGTLDGNEVMWPLLTLLPIHFWAFRQPQSVSSGLVFLAGMTADVLTGGPFGYWALVYLVGLGLSRRAHTMILSQNLVASWVTFLIVMPLTACVGFGVASAYAARLTDWYAIALAAAVGIAAQPVFGLLGGWLERQRAAHALGPPVIGG